MHTNHPEAKRWNRRYAERTHSYGLGPSSFLVDSLRRIGVAESAAEPDTLGNTRRPGHALDVAMGEGRNALYMAQCGFSVFGLDVSLVAAARATAVARRNDLSLAAVVGDLDRWCLEPRKLDGCGFDCIVQFYFLDRALFPKLIGALRPGGHLVVETFSTRHAEVSDFGPRNPGFLLDPSEARDLIAGLEPLIVEDQIVEVDEGRHQGPAGLIRILARKPTATLSTDTH